MQVIQPRSPKQNGCVERCQRTWRKELYETSSVVATLDEYRRDARCFVVDHNHVRSHAALGGMMPIGYLRKHHGESLRRNLIATDLAGKPTPERPAKNAIYSDCVQRIDYAASIVYSCERSFGPPGREFFENINIFNQSRMNNLLIDHR